MVGGIIQRIKVYIDSIGGNVSAFEKEVGMSNGSFASQFKNNKTIGVDKLENILNRYTDIDYHWLLTGEGEMLKLSILEEKASIYKKISKYDKTNIPLYDVQTPEGIVDLFGDNEHQVVVDYIRIPKISECDGALYVSGDSMYPLLKSGDIVAYRKILNIESNIIWGEMYLVYVNNDGNESFFIRFLKQSERESYVQFVAQNPHHQTIEFHVSSIKALALVKGSVRINTML
ncbi:peptidase S24-like protein [Flavobacterium araucananum]|jgi:phage repressor protein C with HTH and peptisase S24 domain|uniref:Peptidase S24 n=1 Tax=Flavobacterium araucananum TaxID=946678 RepID=A0A227NVG1_9FLAO|nr:S24 family peptidase [Flavobacterium araucananum]OXG00805.1 peptidase S24 [Flavobacterium araucananum]PWK03294.1 peptidase S24-like protein [Flavobacterium araucananum]